MVNLDGNDNVMKARRKRLVAVEAADSAQQRRHTLGDRLRELRKAKGRGLDE